MTEQESQQAQAIAEIKKYANSDGRGESMIAIRYQVVRSVVSIVDSQAQNIAELQARAPKQYTEAELREGFASQYQDGLHVGENGEFTDRQIEADFAEWVECARFLGAIKDTHAEPIT